MLGPKMHNHFKPIISHLWESSCRHSRQWCDSPSSLLLPRFGLWRECFRDGCGTTIALSRGGVGSCSADPTVILVVTGNIHHRGASNAKHIPPQPDQSQAAWTTQCPVMPYFDHIIGEQLQLTKHPSDFLFLSPLLPPLRLLTSVFRLQESPQRACHKLCGILCAELAWKLLSGAGGRSVFIGVWSLIQGCYNNTQG